MPLYDGTPLVRLEGDKAKALGRIPEAKLLLSKAQAVAKNAGVSTFSMSQRTDEGYMYALTANGVDAVFVSANPDVVGEVQNETPLVITEHGFPDILSGVVVNGLLADNVLNTFAPTAQCRTTHSGLAAGKQQSRRLAVRPWPANDVDGNPDTFSQYTALKPSMYTGMMCKVVQAVMGLGRINPSKLGDKAINKQDPQLSAYMRHIKSTGVQVRYDYKFHRTHGIYVGPDGVLWLIEIGINRGILARPLPIVPGSNKPPFRDSITVRGDSDMLEVLDALGCVPTGEAFPNTPTELAKAKARGDVIELMPASGMREFYKNSPYSSACGWAFSDSGAEAHNTAYGYESDTAEVQTGYHYQVNISIGPVVSHRQVGTPVGSGSASLVVQSKGALYGVGKLGKFLPYKIHEPVIGGLLSHDASPMVAQSVAPFCDTTMHVFFDEGELKAVKFYLNPEEDVVDETEDSRYPGECIYNGEWTIVHTTGRRAFPRMMYTNDIDDRRVLKDNVVTTHIKSKDIGFDPPRFGDFPQAPEYCFVYRERVFERITTVTTVNGDSLGSVLVVPEFSRSAYYYITSSTDAGGPKLVLKTYDFIKDPNTGYGWRKFVRIGAPPLSTECTDNTFICGTTHTDRRIICTGYEPDYVSGFGGVDGDCYQYADFGPWLTICQNIESLCSAQMNNSLPVHIGSSSSSNVPPKTEQKLVLVSPGYGGQLEIKTGHASYSVWARPSPDPDTLELQHISSTHSCLGEDALVYYDDLKGSGQQKTFGPLAVTIGGSDNPTFIGVNGNG